MSVEVSIEKLVYGGEGLARTPEGIVLVGGALPGEQVSIEMEPAKRGVRRAQLLEVLSPSPFRTAAPCPYFSECGGCQHQQTAYEKQLEWKRDILSECFERIGKLKISTPITTISADPWGYRNRIRLHAQKTGGDFQVGFQRPGSNDICQVDSCAISSPAIQQAVHFLASGGLTSALPEGQFEIELFAGDEDRELLATITSDLPAPDDFGAVWQAAIPQFVSIGWAYRAKTHPSKRAAVRLLKTWGSGEITVRVDDYQYRVSHESFFQTNRFLLGRMIAVAMDEARGERALDLFAGVGFFTLPAARRFTDVVAVESHPGASRDLRANAKAASKKIHVYPNTAESFLASRPSRQPWDLILVDPPRHGLSAPVREGIVNLQPKSITYVSCDPTTLARDLAVFEKSGYQVIAINLLDLFPQTYHLEAIVHLTR